MHTPNTIGRLRCVAASALVLLTAAGDAHGADARTAAEAELRALSARVPEFQVVALPTEPGEVVLEAEQSLTVEHLRGVGLDDDPPVLRPPANSYDPRMSDAYPPEEAPYVAAGIQPFRFKHFNCEFNYGGWHNFGMADYAAAHGFNIIFPYVREIDQGSHLPVVRRVKLGPIHIVITYDPGVVHGGEPRRIVLADFDGRPGLTLTLPADEQTRVFVLREK